MGEKITIGAGDIGEISLGAPKVADPVERLHKAEEAVSKLAQLADRQGAAIRALTERVAALESPG